MTNEELDCARATEAVRLRLLPGLWQHETVIAARLAREGWTPPVAVDPDIAEAEAIWFEGKSSFDLVLAGIKRGRALAAEAKPGLVWVKHDGSRNNPLEGYNSWILADRVGRKIDVYHSSNDWRDVRHYAIINNPPEGVA